MAADQLKTFEECRPLLASIAARILGGQDEVDDMLQEACLRWQRTDSQHIESPKAFLTATVARLCINHINLARVRAERTGATVPADQLRDPDRAPDEVAELADALAEGFNLMIARLSPTERVVFLLREAFEFEYEEIARIVDRTGDNCRQILKRARNRIRHEKPLSMEEPQGQIVSAFREAVETGDMDQVLRLLSRDVELVQDGGDISKPAPPPAMGAKVLAELTAYMGSAAGPLSAISFNLRGKHVVAVKGRQDKIAGAFLLEMREGRIGRIRLVRCPIMLNHIALLSLGCFQEGTPSPHLE